MRRINHLTPHYIFCKIAVLIDERKNPDHPWLTKESVKILEHLLKNSDLGIEFGSGRSTRWLLKRISKLTSIETDKSWYEKVKKLNCKDIEESRLNYLLAQSKQDYKNIIKSFENESLDFCLIDGKFRETCATGILDKLKVGGVLVLDNVNWFIPCEKSKSPDSLKLEDGFKSEVWEHFYTITSSWRYIWTSNSVSDTGIWIKTS